MTLGLFGIFSTRSLEYETPGVGVLVRHPTKQDKPWYTTSVDSLASQISFQLYFIYCPR